MRILHCVHSCNPKGGGVWEAVAQFAKEHIESGHKVQIATMDDPTSKWCQGLTLPILPLGPSTGYGYCRNFNLWLRSHALNFDCVIVHGLWQYQGVATMRILAKIDVPYFVFPHGMLDPWFKESSRLKHFKKSIYWKFVESKVLERANGVVFTCVEERDLAASTFQPYRCSPLVAPLGIHATDGASSSKIETFYQSFPAIRDKPYLLYLGRVHPKKGLNLLLESFLEMKQSIPDLVIAGPIDDKPFEMRMMELINKIHVDHPGWKCLWAGMLEGGKKWGALHAASAFVLPSHQENFGIAVVEALSVGTPVLITEKVNIYREIVEAKAGLACEDTVEGVKVMISRWMAMNGLERETLAANATKCFLSNYEISRAAAHLINVLQEAIGSRQ